MYGWALGKTQTFGLNKKHDLTQCLQGMPVVDSVFHGQITREMVNRYHIYLMNSSVILRCSINRHEHAALMCLCRV